MIQLLTQNVIERLAREDAVLVHVDTTQGSAPRDAGTWMAVFRADTLGTIGGGRLEWQAIDLARRHLQGTADLPGTVRVPLGPSLGQCCGGVVHLRFERVGPADREALRGRLAGALTPVAVFGGGHVGHALVRVLATLPFDLRWIDSRDDIFPADRPARAECEHSDPVHLAVPSLAAGSHVIVMSFSHAEDLDIVAACLHRQRERADLPFIGLIGSKTKWARFRHRLEAQGFSPGELAHVTCPIGLPGIPGKEPEVIAIGVAAQLLARRAA